MTLVDGLGISVLVTMALWFVLLQLLSLFSRLVEPDAAPPGSDAINEHTEPPAVAGYLAGACELSGALVSATALDLAARGYLEIDKGAPGQDGCHVRAVRDSPTRKLALMAYEQMVLDRVSEMARGGSVLCAALSMGDGSSGHEWRRRFDDAVRKDARERGLTRGRWSRGALISLIVAGCLPVALSVAALVAAFVQSPNHQVHGGRGGPLALIGVVVGLMVSGWALYRSDRPTPTGELVWARWLGLREQMRRDEGLASASPAAVATWGRRIAYATALGAAPNLLRAMPFGLESDTEVWSSYGGRWHLVRVGYPKRGSWGEHPSKALLNGTLMLIFPTVVIAGVIIAATRAGAPSIPSNWPASSRIAATMGIGLAGLVVLGIAARGLRLISGALQDLCSQHETTGQLVRLRSAGAGGIHRLAVDDGSSDRIVAWKSARRLGPEIVQGQTVTIRAGRGNGYVFALAAARLQERSGSEALLRTPHLEASGSLMETCTADGATTNGKGRTAS